MLLFDKHQAGGSIASIFWLECKKWMLKSISIHFRIYFTRI